MTFLTYITKLLYAPVTLFTQLKSNYLVSKQKTSLKRQDELERLEKENTINKQIQELQTKEKVQESILDKFLVNSEHSGAQKQILENSVLLLQNEVEKLKAQLSAAHDNTIRLEEKHSLKIQEDAETITQLKDEIVKQQQLARILTKSLDEHNLKVARRDLFTPKKLSDFNNNNTEGNITAALSSDLHKDSIKQLKKYFEALFQEDMHLNNNLDSKMTEMFNSGYNIVNAKKSLIELQQVKHSLEIQQKELQANIHTLLEKERNHDTVLTFMAKIKSEITILEEQLRATNVQLRVANEALNNCLTNLDKSLTKFTENMTDAKRALSANVSEKVQLFHKIETQLKDADGNISEVTPLNMTQKTDSYSISRSASESALNNHIKDKLPNVPRGVNITPLRMGFIPKLQMQIPLNKIPEDPSTTKCTTNDTSNEVVD